MLEGRVISKAPKKLRANSTKIRKKSTLIQLVAIQLKMSAAILPLISLVRRIITAIGIVYISTMQIP